MTMCLFQCSFVILGHLEKSNTNQEGVAHMHARIPVHRGILVIWNADNKHEKWEIQT